MTEDGADHLPMVLAHVTESHMRAPLDDPTMARFVFVFDSVARSARGSPGFVWQLESDGPGHPVVSTDDPLRVISVSLWVDYVALHAFVYRSDHGQALLHRADWFEPVMQPSTALWWCSPEADKSTMSAQAVARLSYLRRYGPTPRAFTLTRRFDSLGRPEGRGPSRRGW